MQSNCGRNLVYLVFAFFFFYLFRFNHYSYNFRPILPQLCLWLQPIITILSDHTQISKCSFRKVRSVYMLSFADWEWYCLWSFLYSLYKPFQNEVWKLHISKTFFIHLLFCDLYWVMAAPYKKSI